MIIFLLINFTLPDNARDLGHFIIPAMTCQAGYEITDICLTYTKMDESEREFWKIMGGFATTYLVFTLSKKLREHYETEREWELANSGLKCWQLGITIKFFLKLPALQRKR
jgi:hypothetical protein